MVALVHRGQIDEHVEVADLVTVVGVVCVGAHVGPGATLRVEGDVHGLLVIEPEGTVVVDGAVTGEVINRGYLMVAGQLVGRICHDSGMIAVAAGSLVTAPDGGIDRIDADGRLHTDVGDPIAPVDGRSYLRRVDAAHFRPLADRRCSEDSSQRPAGLEQRDLEVVDIRAGGDWPIWILSNLTPNGFTFAGMAVASMEGFLQSLKFEDPDEAALVRQLAGRKAKRAGKKRREAWQRSGTLWIEGRTIDRFGSRYQHLLDGAYAALFSQCEEARRALLATNDAVLLHTIGEGDPALSVLTPDEFCGRLMRIRADLRRVDGGQR